MTIYHTSIRGAKGALGQAASIKQLHEKHHGTAGIAVAFFNHPNVTSAIVAKTQTRSKAGLRKPGPLSNGLEL
jgi:hypothetical protein